MRLRHCCAVAALVATCCGAIELLAATCATRVIVPPWGAWPATSDWANNCKRTRAQEQCAGPDGASGWTGHYCVNGPNKHHEEMTAGPLFGAPAIPCPHVATTVLTADFRATKSVGTVPCVYYSP